LISPAGVFFIHAILKINNLEVSGDIQYTQHDATCLLNPPKSAKRVNSCSLNQSRNCFMEWGFKDAFRCEGFKGSIGYWAVDYPAKTAKR
jgi:hypothetical protein